MKARLNDEVRYIQWDCSLNCLACGFTIYTPQWHAQVDEVRNRYTYRFSDINKAYYQHIRLCFKLRRLLVTLRNEPKSIPRILSQRTS